MILRGTPLGVDCSRAEVSVPTIEVGHHCFAATGLMPRTVHSPAIEADACRSSGQQGQFAGNLTAGQGGQRLGGAFEWVSFRGDGVQFSCGDPGQHVAD